MKTFHDQHISRKTFEPNQKVWLFNSKLKLFPGKLWSKWDGPFMINRVFSHGAIELSDPKSGGTIKVNGQRLKSYIEVIYMERTIDQVDLTNPP